MKKSIVLLLIIIFPFVVNAKEITNVSTIKLDGNAISDSLIDDDESTYKTIKKGQKITITSKDNIKGIYLIYELEGGFGVLANDTLTTTFGDNGFLHDYIDVESILGLSKEITLTYNSKTMLTDIYVIGEGDIPSFVEIWDKPAEKADLLLYSTHSDDEQLFFSGLLPYYVAKGASVQVVYFTNHNNNKKRLHEQLHGLYTVGIRHYPVFSPIPDEWAPTLTSAMNNMKSAGVSEDEAMKYLVTTIRRFKPLVIVTHDEKGEYGHGQHMLCTYLVERAIDHANDQTYDEKSYNEYGKWATKKVYIHLYPKNQIHMDYDEPLDYFDGKTAFNVSQLGFSKHYSQQYTWFRRWMNGNDNEITKASQIKTYSPCEYGLFRSLVGVDTEKNDMFENLSFYKDITNEEELNNEDVIPTISEKPMDNPDTSMNAYRLVMIFVIIFSGLGVLILIRKL